MPDKTERITIRDARPSDIPAIVDIYNESVVSSTATFLLAGGCYLAALAVRFGLLPLEQAAARAMVLQGAVLSANLLLMLAVGLHARHVLLDARGMLRRRKRAAEDEEDDSLSGEDAEGDGPLAAGQNDLQTRLLLANGAAITVHPSHGIPPPNSAWIGNALTAPVNFMPASSSSACQPALPAAPLPPAPVNRKLTKQEKKVLRERLERMRREREQRG